MPGVSVCAGIIEERCLIVGFLEERREGIEAFAGVPEAGDKDDSWSAHGKDACLVACI